MKIAIIIQARMGSTRMPGKILTPFYEGQTILDVLLNNLHKIDGVEIIVATSVSKENDMLESFLKARGELVYRGSENDVLDRFVKAAKTYNTDRIIRVCADNPFMDRHSISELVRMAKSSDSDYIGFKINDTPSILTHFGFWGEFVTLSALERVASTTAANTPAHEHVTYHVYNHQEDFKCEWLSCPKFMEGRKDIRLTIDTPDDFRNASFIYAGLIKLHPDFTLEDIVNYLDYHPDIKEQMSVCINRNPK